jgi:LysM repeat protein
MKLKILLTTAFLLTLSLSLFAKPVADSVGVRNDDGKKVVQYKIKAGDTYYSIGKRYHIKPEAIMKYNGAKKAALTIGKIIDVPTSMPFKGSSKAKETAETSKKTSQEKSKKEEADVPKKETKKEKKERLAQEAKEAQEEKKHKHKQESDTADEQATVTQPETAPERVAPQPVQQPAQQPVQPAPQNNTPPIQYKVSAGETLYAISKRFNTTVDDLTQLNNLSSTNIQPGQILLVRSSAPGSVPQQPTVVRNESPILAKRDSTSVVVVNKDSSDRHLNANRFGLFEKNENGVATWMDDPGLDPNKKLVLHRTAPIGTVIKITNPMTNRTTFAKVVGRFTDTESTKDVIIVMTKNVADALGAMDKRFHVDISYGSPTE